MKDPQYFDLDKNALDEEWVQQVKLYHAAAERLADARRDWEHAQAEAKIAAAEVGKEARDFPLKYGLEKVTEPGIKEAITLSKKSRDAELAAIEAQHAYDVCKAEVETLDHRKHALQNLVQLRLADYFAEPRVSGNGRERMDEAERRSAFKAKCPNCGQSPKKCTCRLSERAMAGAKRNKS